MCKNYRRMGSTVFKNIVIILVGMIIVPIIALFIGRSVNDFRLRLPGGVREKGYIQLGGVKQYINIRGANTSNPVVIYLHGGPGQSPVYIGLIQKSIDEADYTLIYWDQRGSGRSYIKSLNAALSFEILLNDLDELVDYATERFNQPIVIVGHSWGTMLGGKYAEAYSDKIAGFIGIGQAVDRIEAERLTSIEAARLAREAGNEPDALEIETLFQIFLKDPLGRNDDGEALWKLVNLEYKYLPQNPGKDTTIAALLSPDFDWDSLRYELLRRTDIVKYAKVQNPLRNAFDGFAPPDKLKIPVVLIQGSIDYVTPAVLTQEYFERLTAPRKEIVILPGIGHSPMDEEGDFEMFSETLRKGLASILF